ncbi:HAD family hydrolase [Qipengyuania pelagi]|uniref:phosphoglycolate phosphatase n=1 Tax=Qipengyuania pelagi TaxID=994320 RepID=A0A844Y3R6_9SPHN|nr:HAD hydrolase-like protein [Qipengyuania pelagi]MXO52845.1 HAD hydrolase-like protein [Qipengyuania pelagi]
MSDFPFDIVCFDLDGTLLETHRDLGTAVNHALTLGGFATVPVESAKDLIGGGAKAMLKQAVDAQTKGDGALDRDAFKRLYKAMLAYYGEHYAVHTRPYPGVIETLDALEKRGVRLAVVTNKFQSFAGGVLSSLDLIDRFDCVIGGDSLGKGEDGEYRAKPLPDPILAAQERCGGGSLVYIGDSSYDRDAARAAKVLFIAACYGYCDLTAEQFGADALIQSMDELVPAIESF